MSEEISFKSQGIHHRILAAVCREDRSCALIKTNARLSVTVERVRQVMQELLRAKLVRSVGSDCWSVTELGLHVNLRMGDAFKNLKIEGSAAPRSQANRVDYDGKELGRTCYRPGAYDAYDLPSIIGPQRVYGMRR